MRSLLPVVLLGWLLRALPLLWDVPIFADEGVYYAASAWIWEGRMPYADFVLVHPPGITVALLPVSWMEPAHGFMAARVMTTLVGAANILLLGRFAGLPAALAYAVWPEVVAVERGPALEPWLNLAVLGMLNTRGWASGALAGVALAVKLWALPWFLVLLLRRDWRALVALPVAFAVVLAPFVGPELFDMVLGFQVTRPAHGADRLARVWLLLHPQHLGFTLLAAWGAWRYRPPVAGVWALCWVAMFAAPGFWTRYMAFMGLATSSLVTMPRRWVLAVPVSLALAACLVQAAASDAPVPEGAMGLDPAVTLRANRLPPIPDLYATMLRAGGSVDSPVAQEVVVGMLRDEERIWIRQPDREWLTPESEAALGLDLGPRSVEVDR